MCVCVCLNIISSGMVLMNYGQQIHASLLTNGELSAAKDTDLLPLLSSFHNTVVRVSQYV